MVYDNTIQRRSVTDLNRGGSTGFSIHDIGPVATESAYCRYEIYTDDGRGNGDYVCACPELGWARAIAQALDHVAEQGRQFIDPRTAVR